MTTRTPTAEKPVQLDISILGRDYKVACKESERAELMQAVALLDARMREIRDAGKVAAIDRIAVMAALNLANELMKLKQRNQRVEVELGGRVRSLRARVESTLEKGQQLEL